MLFIKDFLDNLAKTSRYDFQLWTADSDLVFSSEPLANEDDPYQIFKAFSGKIISGQTLLKQTHQDFGTVLGQPLKNGMDVAGALIACCPENSKHLPAKAGPAAGLPDVGEMQAFLTHLARVIESQLSSHMETEKLAEELSQSFEDLALFSRIGDHTRSLNFSSKMLYSLIETLLETMRADLTFAWLPEQPDYNAVILNDTFPVPDDDPKTFVRALIERIPPDAFSANEEYYIMQNSGSIQGYKELHPEAFRFLAVRVETKDHRYGWMGVVSFNMNEIFRQSELKLLNSLAFSTAMAIENSRLFAESVQMTKRERSVRNIFQKYVPEAIANEILERGDSDLITLGERRLVTLLNVDMRGYSRMSKKLKSEDVVSVLNHFFMTMGSAILNHNGILDKYLGDGILAVFGAPAALENPSLDATLAALDMRREMEIFNTFIQDHYGVNLAMGVSINTGEAIMGNIGFESKMEYTVIGDVVNDTFRLQELTRETPNSILASQTTYQKIKPFIDVKPLGVQTLRGGDGSLEIFEVLDRKKEPDI
jgi:class 3 adenylate cyclase